MKDMETDGLAKKLILKITQSLSPYIKCPSIFSGRGFRHQSQVTFEEEKSQSVNPLRMRKEKKAVLPP
jgi:hypothetical protein